MKKPYRYVVPVALGTILTACSHTSVITDSASSESNAQTLWSASPQDVEQSNVLSPAKVSELELLRQRIADNADRIVQLTAQLDEKDRLLAELMSNDKDAALLLTIQQLEKERNALEIRYNQLRLENDRLTAQIHTLENDIQVTKLSSSEQQADFVALNRNFRTLDSAHYALSKDYRDLSIEHAHLKSQLDTLTEQNKHLAQEFSLLNEENLKLGGALSEARAQHQVLWDKIRVQGNVIDTLQTQNAELQRKGGLIIAAEGNPDNLPDLAKLEAKITRLKAELSAQNDLISGYQVDVAQLESALTRQENDLNGQLETLQNRYQELTARHKQLNAELSNMRDMLNARDQRIASLQQELDRSDQQKATLLAEIKQLREQHEDSLQQIVSLEQQAAVEAEQKTKLENQVNNLIPFEGAVMSLQRQLQSELTNVRWTLPTSANLHDTFEIQLSAEVNNPVQGQTYYAELFVDSALSMMSAAEAESTLNQGQLNFRWRLSGLNERPNATMNVSVTQEVNYNGQVILRKIYRDTESVELISKDWLSKYGFWAAAILGGLLMGFGVGKLGRRT
ncbi:hypothetical protein [Marinomonas fungiae]|uniref:Uncharacterized protein n=1 Tax=Marinomonas fungiae TaxID=1137284 RepID=A0A0K6IK18_9GAMM|nr:hypothetical protein [Marinomonas fungiae]CUB03454.1 hypothetical protein Ga0061065_103305 [Marinomonas fungiae]